MKEIAARKIRIGSGIVLGVLTGIVALLFLIETASLYYSGLAAGGDIYSRAIVGAHLKRLIAPVALWLVAAVAGFAVSVKFPAPAVKRKAADTAVLARLRKRIPQGTGEEFLAEKKRYDRFELVRVLLWCLAALVSAAGAVYAIVYLANAAHFTAQDISSEILALVKNVAPWVGAGFLLFIAAAAYEYFSAKYVLASVKRLIVAGKGAPVPEKRQIEGMGSEKLRLAVWLALFAVGATFLVLGILNDGAGDVLKKAVMICTECIGLG